MNSKGFTLVEVMITIAILAMMTAVVVPYTSGWSDSANRLRAQGVLTEAVGRARGAALRNAMGATADAPVAVVCLKDGDVNVLQGTSVAQPSCTGLTGKTIWKATIRTDVSITQDGNDYQCSCFNNRGGLTTEDCSACGTSYTFTIATGNADDEKETVILD